MVQYTLRKTPSLTPTEVEHKWFVVDVADLPLGRISTAIAWVLRGKHKPTFTHNLDCGDFVVVVNADKVALTGNKWNGKLYRKHTMFPGGLKTWTAKQMRDKKPELMLEEAIWGMLPKGPLGRRIFKKLKVYVGTNHPHAAQQPVPMPVPELGIHKK